MEHSKLWDLRFKWTSDGQQQQQQRMGWCNNKDDPPNSHQKSKSNNDARNLNSRVRVWVRVRVRVRIRIAWRAADGRSREVIHCSKQLDNIRKDYCEIYFRELGENRSCSITDNIVTTEDYEMSLDVSTLQINWKNPVFHRWNIYKISNEADYELVKIIVHGIRSEVDIRISPGVHYLGLLGIREIGDYNIYLPSLVITEADIHYANGPQNVSFEYVDDSPLNSMVINNYIRKTMNNTKQIEINNTNTFEIPTLTMEENVFHGKNNMSGVTFTGLKVEGLTAKTFENLTSLSRLIFDNVVLKDFSFLRSSTLQESLTSFIMNPYVMDLKNFDKFTNLETIEVNRYKFFANLTAFICESNKRDCQFTFGINKVACPLECNCTYDREESRLEIDCGWKNLTTIPSLPVPKKGHSLLIFHDNLLTELPYNSLEGYKNIQSLDVSYNQLTSLSVSQLPESLYFLNIRYNNITTLSPQVVEYLHSVNTFFQYDNKWIIYCDENYLQDFFRNKAKLLRIKTSEFDRIMTYANADIPASFLRKFFVEHIDHLYLEANEDEIIGAHDSSYSHLKAMEYLNTFIWMFMGEFDEIILHHLKDPCPYRCSCCVERQTGELIINCRNLTLQFYPRLLDLIPNNTTLYLDANEISYPDNNKIKYNGYPSIQKLHMSQNLLTELSLSLLSNNLTYLDVRNNLLIYLDDDVVAFLENRENVTKVELSGNPWECNCRKKVFLSYLRKHEPMEYETALRRVGITQDKCPADCICCVDTSNSESLTLMIDCSGKDLREIPPLPTLVHGQATLIFERNNLEKWPSSLLPGYSNVTRLYLANNRLSDIDHLPEKLIHLDISNNKFSALDGRVRGILQKRMNSSQMKLSLLGNPWTCSCKEKDFLVFVKAQARNIANASAIQCSGTGRLLIEIEQTDICPSVHIYFTSLAVSLLILALSLNVFVCFRRPIMIWFYEHEICLSLAARRELDEEKKFDAFLSFTHKDEELVEEFVDRLENGKHKFRLCFYLRDWLVGECIPDCINRSVQGSRRIIILMTQNFLQSTWGRLEFRLALHATSKDRCKRLIVVVYPDVENFDDLDSELKAYMVMNTYLERNHPNFWNKLMYSMPHDMHSKRRRSDAETEV
ncbi:LOW QUALITY PROTEIN: protein toll-like [Drosophila teissieri]|uniref:LOW QUALITY PROTEIN: protein toll-like n=1 Tax=Drosophila teissieri TaxID=7243 RepID=UPI001CBA0054|nr:LOW QUALITY PROTEIN: protein toll-like [Drosophila teissieri]